jgi:hypothetical protein
MDSKQLKDFYQVGLFLHCKGEKDAATGKETVTYCNDRMLQFSFDPTDVWQLKNTSIQDLSQIISRGVFKRRRRRWDG